MPLLEASLSPLHDFCTLIPCPSQTLKLMLYFWGPTFAVLPLFGFYLSLSRGPRLPLLGLAW